MTETVQSAPPQETRIRWIDTAKLIGIFLVILGHLPLAAGKSGISPATFIYTFHMPLFFFLSGLVEKNRPVRQTLVRSAKSLLIPYAAYYRKRKKQETSVLKMPGVLIRLGCKCAANHAETNHAIFRRIFPRSVEANISDDRFFTMHRPTAESLRKSPE